VDEKCRIEVVLSDESSSSLPRHNRCLMNTRKTRRVYFHFYKLMIYFATHRPGFRWIKGRNFRVDDMSCHAMQSIRGDPSLLCRRLRPDAIMESRNSERLGEAMPYQTSRVKVMIYSKWNSTLHDLTWAVLRTFLLRLLWIHACQRYRHLLVPLTYDATGCGCACRVFHLGRHHPS